MTVFKRSPWLNIFRLESHWRGELGYHGYKVNIIQHLSSNYAQKFDCRILAPVNPWRISRFSWDFSGGSVLKTSGHFHCSRVRVWSGVIRELRSCMPHNQRNFPIKLRARTIGKKNIPFRYCNKIFLYN